MSHAQYEEWLAVYSDLTPAERAEVDAHLSTCAACAARLAEVRALQHALQARLRPRPDARLRAGFYAAVAQAQRADRRPGPWARLMRATLALGNAAAWAGIAAVTVLLLAGLAITGPELARRAWPAARPTKVPAVLPTWTAPGATAAPSPTATPTPPTAEPAVAVARLERLQDLCCPPTFAPDGKTYFTIDDQGVLRLYSLAGDAARELPVAVPAGAEADWRLSNAAWTPDGAALVATFGSLSHAPHDVYLVDPASGAARRLGETYSPLRLVFDARSRLVVTTPAAYLALDLDTGDSTQVPGIWPRLNAEQPEITFSPDGRSVATVEAGKLSIVDLGTGARTLINTHVYPFRGGACAWSGDGRRLAYATGERGAAPELWVVGADGAGARRLVAREDARDTGGSFAGLAWLPGTLSIVYDFVPWSNASTLQAEYQVVSAEGGPARTLFKNGLGLTLSPDGHVISFVRDLQGPDETGNWIAVLEYGGVAMPATPTPVATPPADPDQPSRRTLPTPTPYLPDLTPPPSGWIAYVTGGPKHRLTLTSPDGARRVALDDLGPVSAFSWSPDGKWLAMQRGERLSLIALDGPRFVDVTEGVWGGSPSWSRDAGALAYIHRRVLAKNGASEYSLCLYDVAAGRTITTSVSVMRAPEWSRVCGQVSGHLVPVLNRFDGTLQVWDVAAGQAIVSLPHADAGLQGLSADRTMLWLPDGRGVVFARVETGRVPIELPEPEPNTGGVSETELYPTSLALWRVGDQAAQTVLEAGERQRVWPEGWLPDGRLEVRVMEWSKDRYVAGDTPGPEHVTYRYFRATEDGRLAEASGEGLPWWAGGGLRTRLGWPVDPQGALFHYDVGPDGQTVVFTEQCAGQESSACVYLWQGEGEPVLLGPGESPQWQPE